MFYSDDPVADSLRYDAEQDRQLERLPRCCECDEPIQDEYCYEFNDELICPDCLLNNHRHLVEYYTD